MTAVISVCIFKKRIKIGEFLCSYFNIEDGRKMQHFQRIVLCYFKRAKNATEMENEICVVYGESAVAD